MKPSTLVEEIEQWSSYLQRWVPPTDTLPEPFSMFELAGGPYADRAARRLAHIDSTGQRMGGAEGTVWLAKSADLPGQRLALKFFPPPLYSRAKYMDQIQRMVQGYGSFLQSFRMIDLRSLLAGDASHVAADPSSTDEKEWLPLAIVYKAADLTLDDVLSILGSRGQFLPIVTAHEFVEALLEAFVELAKARVSHQDMTTRNAFLLLSRKSKHSLLPTLQEIQRGKCVLGDFGCAIRWDDLNAEDPQTAPDAELVDDDIPPHAHGAVRNDLTSFASLISRVLDSAETSESSQRSQLLDLADKMREFADNLSLTPPIRFTTCDLQKCLDDFRKEFAFKRVIGSVYALNYRSLAEQVAMAQSDVWIFGTYLSTLLTTRNLDRDDVRPDDCKLFRDGLHRILSQEDGPVVKLFFLDPFSPHAILRGHQLTKGSSSVIIRSAETLRTLQEICSRITHYNKNAMIRVYDFVPSFFFTRVDDVVRLIFFPVRRTAAEKDTLLLTANAPTTQFVRNMLDEYSHDSISIALVDYFHLSLLIDDALFSIPYLCLRTVASDITYHWIVRLPDDPELFSVGTSGVLMRAIGSRQGANSRFRMDSLDNTFVDAWAAHFTIQATGPASSQLDNLFHCKYGSDHASSSSSIYRSLTFLK